MRIRRKNISCPPTIEVHNLLSRYVGIVILVVDVLGGLILATGLLLGLDLLANEVTEPGSLISTDWPILCPRRLDILVV